MYHLQPNQFLTFARMSVDLYLGLILVFMIFLKKLNLGVLSRALIFFVFS